jgi:hypothetical protein
MRAISRLVAAVGTRPLISIGQREASVIATCGAANAIAVARSNKESCFFLAMPLQCRRAATSSCIALWPAAVSYIGEGLDSFGERRSQAFGKQTLSAVTS